jgi:predicted Rossmann fold flavoprotein
VPTARRFDVLVLGAGAAGLMCAIEAGKRGRRVVILERAGQIGKKILISGGGRCNFTNLHCTPENFISEIPDFAKSALARYTPAHFITLVQKHGIAYHEKTMGQLFCDGSSAEITRMLEAECRSVGVRIVLDCQIREVQRTSEFLVECGSAAYVAEALVVATGGLSIPKMGATSFGYELARQFGLAVVPTRPALVPLLFQGKDQRRYSELAGVSTDVIATSGKQRFREKMLFTHRGLSGPAILQISSYWTRGEPIFIDLVPNKIVTSSLRESSFRSAVAAQMALQSFLPKRLATRWLEFHEPTAWNNKGLANLEEQIHAWSVLPSGTEGYAKAEVTAGGVDTRELSSKTMEARKVPGLYFIGEVVDVTGHLGGFNFQWAWASGAAAGRAV